MTRYALMLVGKHTYTSQQITFVWIMLLVGCQHIQSESHIHYVTSNDTQCPPEVPISLCNTLDWYSQHRDISFISNTTMVFLEGIHFLNAFIEVSTCNNFTMIGREDALSDVSRTGLPQPRSQIICSAASKHGLSFINSSKIHIVNLALNACSGMVTLKHNFKAFVALAFVQVINLTLYHVVINNTKGFGLYCYNVFGEIRVNESMFANAKGDSHLKLYSGNAQFWFGSPCSAYNTGLIISSSSFMDGHNIIISKLCNASGLQILLFCPKIQVIMDNITVYGNKGFNGGNIGISLIDFGSDTSTTTISNSHICHGWAAKGGGIGLWSRLQFSVIVPQENHQIISVLSISNSTFYGNIANSTPGGAIYVTYHYDHYDNFNPISRKVSISNCNFIQNSAAMAILKWSVVAYISLNLSVQLHSCNFHNNGVPSEKGSSIVELIGITYIALANCNFTGSYGSVLYLQSSCLNLYGEVRFENNSALYGGAVKIYDSSLIYLHNGTNVFFINNTALKGGALYVKEGSLETVPPCIFQTLVHSAANNENINDPIKVKFVNNSATHAGDAIYGGNFDYCYMLATMLTAVNDFNDTFSFLDVSEQNGLSSITSDPRGVCFCEKNKLCKESTHNLTIYPGQTFSVAVTAIGQLNGSSMGVIDANIVDNNPSSYNALLSAKNCSSTLHKGCVNLTYTLHSNLTDVKINFTSVIADLNVYHDPINATLHVSLLPCPYGFSFTKLSPRSCECSYMFENLTAKCDINNQVIQVCIHAKSSMWFGCDKHIHSNNSVCHPSVAFGCFHYCSQTERCVYMIKWNISDDQQCLAGLTGISCSTCKPGLSRMLGSLSKCQVCSNKN